MTEVTEVLITTAKGNNLVKNVQFSFSFPFLVS